MICLLESGLLTSDYLYQIDILMETSDLVL